MKLFFAIALALTAAQPLLALSCLKPDPVRLYQFAEEAEDGYWIVKGNITLVNSIPDATEGNPVSGEALFTGMGLRLDGTYSAFAQPIRLINSCLGPWCAGLPDDGTYFAAIRVTDNGPVLELDPCYTTLVPVTPDGERRLLACVGGGSCETGDF